jgi:hypothetical protein
VNVPYRIEYRDEDGRWRFYANAATPQAAATRKVWETCHRGMRVLRKSDGQVVVAWSGRIGMFDWCPRCVCHRLGMDPERGTAALAGGGNFADTEGETSEPSTEGVA